MAAGGGSRVGECQNRGRERRRVRIGAHPRHAQAPRPSSTLPRSPLSPLRTARRSRGGRARGELSEGRSRPGRVGAEAKGRQRALSSLHRALSVTARCSGATEREERRERDGWADGGWRWRVALRVRGAWRGALAIGVSGERSMRGPKLEAPPPPSQEARPVAAVRFGEAGAGRSDAGSSTRPRARGQASCPLPRGGGAGGRFRLLKTSTSRRKSARWR